MPIQLYKRITHIHRQLYKYCGTYTHTLLSICVSKCVCLRMYLHLLESCFSTQVFDKLLALLPLMPDQEKCKKD